MHMKKTTAKKSAARAKGAASARSKKPARRGSSKGKRPSGQPLITKQPQSKQQAALQLGMFLHVDDAWSLAYFNNQDLHFVERELFG